MRKNALVKKGFNVSLVLLILALSFQDLYAQMLVTENKIGEYEGYDYELWFQNGEGSMELTGGGTFKTSWQNSGQGEYNILARTGKRPGSKEQVVEYAADYNPNGTSYLCVYGWFKNPLVEYYVVESWNGYNPSTGAQQIGEFTSDGGTYKIYKTRRINKPSIEGDTDFDQYWSVRQQQRSSGTVTTANHFKEWAKSGLEMGDMYEVSMTVEGYQSSGSCNMYKMIMTKGWPQDPTVSFTSPADKSGYMAGDEISIAVNAQAKQGSIVKVEFFAGKEKIGESTSAPYAVKWTPSSNGTFPITAIATDSEGWDTEEIINVIVRVPQGPYKGVPHALPGKFEFEDFDEGGQDSAYYDDSPGNKAAGIAYRENEDVDIEECSEGGYSLGYTDVGEWMEYTVHAAGAGTYQMNVRVACNGSGRLLTVQSDGNTIAKDITIPNTGDWQTWQTVSKEVELKAGKQILRFIIGGEDYLNLNYVEFEAIDIEEPPTDLCPNNPNKLEPGICGCDVDDIDSDNDGVMDCDDLCANDPNKTEPGECGCGTPEGTCQKPEIQLYKGWNLLGYPIEGATDIEQALSSIWENVKTVKDTENFYDKRYAPHFNLLTKLKYAKGYMVEVDSDCTLTW